MNIRRTFSFILSCSLLPLLSLSAGAFYQPRNMIISVPVSHLMSKPAQRNSSYQKCPFQATQLLYGEQVTAHEELNGFIRVKATEQKAFWKDKWITCSGWIPSTHAVLLKAKTKPNLVVTSHTAPVILRDTSGKANKLTLSFGTKLCSTQHTNGMWGVILADGSKGFIRKEHASPVSTYEQNDILTLRSQLALRGTQFIGDPYVWAGRSAHHPEYTNVSGTDCSGLMNLLYRSIGKDIPRCSQDQYTKSKKIARLSSDNVGDMIFVYYQDPNNPSKVKNRISHVMMYLGNDRILEAEGDLSGHVRVVLGRQRFGKAIEQISSGDKVWQYKKLSESPMGNKKVITQSPLGKCKLVFGSYL